MTHNEQQMFQNGPSNPIKLNNVNTGGNNAILFIFSPRYIGDHTIRPYVYNFNGNILDQIQRAPSVTEAVGRSDISRNISEAVLPSSEGINLSTSALSHQWTFVLVIDIVLANRAKSRFINCGFFIGEPINPNSIHMTTPTVNPNSVLVFTNSTHFKTHDVFSERPKQEATVVSNNDVVPLQTKQFCQEPLFLLDPGSIANYSVIGAGTSGNKNTSEHIALYSNIDTLGQLSVENQEHAHKLPTRIKSPKHHLREILSSIEMANFSMDSSYTKDGYTCPSVVGNELLSRLPEAVDPHSQYCSTVISSLRDSMKHFGAYTPGTIDPSSRLTMNDIIATFPNLTIQPIKAPSIVCGNDRPQQLNIPQNAYSYMVANTLGTMAIACGLGQISFRYASYSNSIMQSNCGGTWEIFSAETMFPTSQDFLKRCVNQFMMMCTDDLWPILKYVCGEFDIMVHHNGQNETIINLQLLDFQKVDGLYVSNNNITGLTTPSIGTAGILDSNTGELHKMIEILKDANDGSSMRSAFHNFRHDTVEHINSEERMFTANAVNSSPRSDNGIIDFVGMAANRRFGI